MSTKAVIFDLDDTLVSEISYCMSGYRFVAAYAADKLMPDRAEKDIYKELLKLFNMDHYIDPWEKVERLTVAQMQIVEIAKALSKNTDIIILGQGSKGLILFDRHRDINVHYDTVKTNEVVNTTGAGNALFACFLHYYQETGDSTLAIKNAMLFASYKIGYMGTSNGFMTTDQLEQWRNLIWGIKKSEFDTHSENMVGN